MRRRTSESVREKNANLMLKSSSSQADGPDVGDLRPEVLGAGRRDLVDDPLAAGDPWRGHRDLGHQPGAQHPLQRGVERAVGEQPGPAEQQVEPLAQLVAVQRGVVEQSEDCQLERCALAADDRHLLACDWSVVRPVTSVEPIASIYRMRVDLPTSVIEPGAGADPVPFVSRPSSESRRSRSRPKERVVSGNRSNPAPKKKANGSGAGSPPAKGKGAGAGGAGRWPQRGPGGSSGS